MDKTDQQTISDYLKGEEKALAELVNRHLKPVYNFVYRLSGNKQDAEDITQEAFLKVWKNIKKYKPEKSSFKTWLFTIARNTAIDWLRKKRNFVFSDFENEDGNKLENNLVDLSPWPDELVAKAQDKELIDSLLIQLAPLYREVITLRHNNELSFEEIAEILKKPIDTVKSRHRRGLIILRKLLDAPKSGWGSY